MSTLNGFAKMANPECCALKSKKRRANVLINWLTLIARHAHEKARETYAEMLWQTGKWTRSHCSSWDFHTWSLCWKAVIMADIYVMTGICPCSLLFSRARCWVRSHNIAKSHSQFGSDNSSRVLLYFPWKEQFLPWAQKVVEILRSCSATLLLCGLHGPNPPLVKHLELAVIQAIHTRM